MATTVSAGGDDPCGAITAAILPVLSTFHTDTTAHANQCYNDEESVITDATSLANKKSECLAHVNDLGPLTSKLQTALAAFPGISQDGISAALHSPQIMQLSNGCLLEPLSGVAAFITEQINLINSLN